MTRAIWICPALGKSSCLGICDWPLAIEVISFWLDRNHFHSDYRKVLIHVTQSDNSHCPYLLPLDIVRSVGRLYYIKRYHSNGDFKS